MQIPWDILGRWQPQEEWEETILAWVTGPKYGGIWPLLLWLRVREQEHSVKSSGKHKQQEREKSKSLLQEDHVHFRRGSRLQVTCSEGAVEEMDGGNLDSSGWTQDALWR